MCEKTHSMDTNTTTRQTAKGHREGQLNSVSGITLEQ